MDSYTWVLLGHFPRSLLSEFQCIVAFHKVLYKRLYNRLQTLTDELCEHKAFLWPRRSDCPTAGKGAFLGFLGGHHASTGR